MPYSHKNLHSAKELVYLGISDNLTEARKSIRSVRIAIGSANLKDLKAPKQTPPNDNDIDTDL